MHKSLNNKYQQPKRVLIFQHIFKDIQKKRKENSNIGKII